MATPGGTPKPDVRSRLGLAPGTVEIFESDTQWPEIYQSFAADLAVACADIPVEIAHIGSTSVPGLAAKPVIDIAIGAAAPLDPDDFISRVSTCGFDFVADLGMHGGLFFTASLDDKVVSHLHVVATDDFQWRWYLGFRDALRADSDLRQAYTQLKKDAASVHARDREAYTKAKSDWLIETVSRIAGG